MEASTGALHVGGHIVSAICR